MAKKSGGGEASSDSGTVWVAFFRGINVGGHNKLPMKALASDLASLEFSGVQTYIQSGNVVFHSAGGTAAAHSKAITELVRVRYGFAPWVLVLRGADLARCVAANPYPEAEGEPKTLHCFFLKARPTALKVEALDAIKKPNESYALVGTVFYLHAPDGIGKSKLAERAERILGVEATARNWRTVCNVLEMAHLR